MTMQEYFESRERRVETLPYAVYLMERYFPERVVEDLDEVDEGVLKWLHPRNVSAAGRYRTHAINRYQQAQKDKATLSDWGRDTENDKIQRAKAQRFMKSPLQIIASPKVTNKDTERSPVMRMAKSFKNSVSYNRDLQNYVDAAHRRFGTDRGQTTMKSDVSGYAPRPPKETKGEVKRRVSKELERNTPEIDIERLKSLNAMSRRNRGADTERGRVTNASGWSGREAQRIARHLGKKYQQDGVLYGQEGKRKHWIETSGK